MFISIIQCKGSRVYPGAYSGSMTLYPKNLKAKPPGAGATAEEEEPSARICGRNVDPRIGLLPMEANVAITAMPNAIAIIARKEISVLLCPPLPFICTSLTKLSCESGSGIFLGFTASKFSAPSCLKHLILLLQRKGNLIVLIIIMIVKKRNQNNKATP